MRMPAKARNDVAVPPRLLQPELSDGTEMLRAIFRFCASDACTPRIGNTTICVATATSSPTATFVTASTSDISRDWRIPPP